MADIALLKNQVGQARVLELVRCHSRRAKELRVAFYAALGESDLGVYLEEMPKVFLEVKRLVDAGGEGVSLDAVMVGVLSAPARVAMVAGLKSRIGRWRSGESVTGSRRAVRAARAAESGVGDSGVGDSGVGDSGVGDSRVGDSGVGDSGVGDSGVGDSGVGDSGVGADSRVGDSGVGADSRVGDSPVDDSLVGGLSRLPAPTGAVMGSVVSRAVSAPAAAVVKPSVVVAPGRSVNSVPAKSGNPAKSVPAVHPAKVEASAVEPPVVAAVARVSSEVVASGSSGELRVEAGVSESRGNLGSKFEALLVRFEALSARLEAVEVLSAAQAVRLEAQEIALALLSPDAAVVQGAVRDVLVARGAVRQDLFESQRSRDEVVAARLEAVEARDVVIVQRLRLARMEEFQLMILEVFHSVSVGWESVVEESRLVRLALARVENRVDQAFALAASSRLWIKNEAVKVLREAGFKVRHPNDWTAGSPKENSMRRKKIEAGDVSAKTAKPLSNQRVMLPKILSADESIDLSVVELPLPMLISVEGKSYDELRARENMALRHLRLDHLGQVVTQYAGRHFP